MKKQDAEPAGKHAAKGDDLSLTEAELDDMRREFREALEQMNKLHREAAERCDGKERP